MPISYKTFLFGFLCTYAINCNVTYAESGIVSVDSSEQVFELDATEYYKAAQRHADSQDYVEAIRYATKAISMENDNGIYYGLRSFLYMCIDKLDEANADITKTISYYPDIAEFYALKGKIQDKMNNFKASIYNYDKAISLKKILIFI